VRRGGPGDAGLDEQIQAAREFAPGLEVQQLKSSVRARLFGTVGGAPTLGGYTLRRMIGRGGMGAVFEAIGHNGEAVALKVLRGFEPAALYRFKLEFRALADIAHPNLALLHHLVVRGDQAFLTMELVDGVDFLQYVHREEPGASARLRAALGQLADGLAALHAAGKLHRDIKPSNVMVTREGRVVILDFGLVHELDGAPAQLVGTPAYMAPEQLFGAAPQAASDWYAVGVILYEALTGRPPFADSSVEVLREKAERDAPAACPAIDPALASLCARLLARRPDDRAGAAEVAAALLGREPAPARTGSPAPFGLVSQAPRAPPSLRLGASPLPGGLVGREAAFAALRRGLEESAERTVVALVRGRSGMGKSALIHALSEAAQAGAAGPQAPAIVLAGRCYEREQVPYNAFDSVIDALTTLLLGLDAAALAGLLPAEIAALARIFPVLRRVTAIAEAAGEAGEGGLRQAAAALQDMLGKLAARGPLVLTIDDVQWSDGDSAALLCELLTGPAAPRCLVVLGVRDDEDADGDPLAGLLERLRAAAVPVHAVAALPLRPQQAEALAESLLRRGGVEGDPAALRARAAAIAAESGGVPLFVRELVHHVRTDMSGRPYAGPVRLEAMVAGRMQRLSPAARAMIEAVAVAGRPLELEVAAQAAGAAGTGRRELQELRAAHLVRASKSPRGELVEAYHDRIRAAVVEEVSGERARALHRRIAEILLLRPGVAPELLADHLRAAGDRARAAECTRVAADRAAEALALLRAAELYRDAAALLSGPDEQGRRDMLEKAGTSLAAAGRRAEAAECFLAAAGLAPELAALSLRQRAAEELLRGGSHERGRTLLQQVLRELGEPLPRGPLARRLRLLGQRVRLWRRGLTFAPRAEADIADRELLRIDALRIARMAIVNFDPATARMYLQEHLLQCLAVGEPSRAARALVGYAAYLSHDGDDDAAVAAALSEGRSLVERGGRAGLRLYAAICEGIVGHNTGRFAAARAALEGPWAQVQGVQGPDAAYLAATRAVWLHSVLAHLGALRSLAEMCAEGAGALRSVGDVDGELRLRANFAVTALLAADAPDEARALLGAAARRFTSDAFPVDRGHAFIAGRMVDLYEETDGAAWPRVQAAWPTYVRGYLFSGQFGRIAGRYWRAAAALQFARVRPHRRAGLVVLVEATARQLASEGRMWADALAHALRAGSEHLRGRDDRAVVELSAGIAGFVAADMRLFAAACRRHRGRLLGGESGAADVAAADAEFGAAGVVAPGRFAGALLPGFDE
jgi:hypothetical protein